MMQLVFARCAWLAEDRPDIAEGGGQVVLVGEGFQLDERAVDLRDRHHGGQHVPGFRGEAVVRAVLLEGDQVLQPERPQDLIDHRGVGDLGLVLGLGTARGVGRGLFVGEHCAAHAAGLHDADPQLPALRGEFVAGHVVVGVPVDAELLAG
jgi:hypothetical protein